MAAFSHPFTVCQHVCTRGCWSFYQRANKSPLKADLPLRCIGLFVSTPPTVVPTYICVSISANCSHFSAADEKQHFLNHPKVGKSHHTELHQNFVPPAKRSARETEPHLFYASDRCSWLIAVSTRTCRPASVTFKQNSEAAQRGMGAGLCAEKGQKATAIQIQGQFKVSHLALHHRLWTGEPRGNRSRSREKVHREKTKGPGNCNTRDLLSARHLQSLSEDWNILSSFFQAALVARWIRGGFTSAHPPAEHQQWDWVAQNKVKLFAGFNVLARGATLLCHIDINSVKAADRPLGPSIQTHAALPSIVGTTQALAKSWSSLPVGLSDNSLSLAEMSGGKKKRGQESFANQSWL